MCGNLVGSVIHVVCRLLGLGHSLSQRGVDGALTPEVALAFEGGRCQRVGILAVYLFTDVDGPCLIDKTRALVLPAKETCNAWTSGK